MEIEYYEPKLYDSFGTQLKEGDSVMSITPTSNRVYFNTIKLDDGILYNNGIQDKHNSDINDGKVVYDDYWNWKVIKIDKK